MSNKLINLTKQQIELLQALNSANKQYGVNKFIYKTEWLGYLPFGQYHWIEFSGQDLKIDENIDLLSELKVLENLKVINKLLVNNTVHETEDIHIYYELVSMLTAN